MKKLSQETKNRFILLIQLLKNWKNERITSKEIAAFLGCKADLIRWDFKNLGKLNGSSAGYKAELLLEELQKACGSEPESEKKRCCVVGLGRLGAALLDNSLFESSGFEIAAGFDSSVNRVEMLRSTFELFPANRIESVCGQKRIEYAFLCCPEPEVEKMIQRLVNAGIKGIVNYTTAVFAVPENVKVQNVSPVTALMSM